MSYYHQLPPEDEVLEAMLWGVIAVAMVLAGIGAWGMLHP